MKLFELSDGSAGSAEAPAAAPLDGSVQPVAGSSVEPFVGPLTRHIESLSSGRAIEVLASVRGHLDAVEARLLAAAIDGGATDREVARMSAASGVSKRAALQKARRAKAVQANATLADKLASGHLNDEKVDAIATAADRTNGAAATDPVLLAQVEAAPVDQVEQVVRKWINNHTTPADTDAKYQHQRRLRCLNRFTTQDNLEAILAVGDTPSIDSLWNQLVADADGLYKAEGGRDVAAGKHPTTTVQRRFDALANRILGPDTPPTGPTAPTVPAKPTPTTRTRPTVFVGTVLHPESGDLCRATLAGGAPLPRAVLDRLLCNADLIASAFDQHGEVLWQGRKVRTATPAQVNALIGRDGGCVLCGAHYLRCEAHHILPWNAPAKGKTDIHHLALVCAGCHHELHDNNQTLLRAPPTNAAGIGPPGEVQPKIIWTTRPATPNEIPPPRPAGRTG